MKLTEFGDTLSENLESIFQYTLLFTVLARRLHIMLNGTSATLKTRTFVDGKFSPPLQIFLFNGREQMENYLVTMESRGLNMTMMNKFKVS